MSYEAEKLAATLKAARERKGLSQRELSARAGVPQSHISKIETSGVNLKISSLAAIANALDLEITLVPRKAIPAVKSISRSVDDVPRPSSDIRKELARIDKQLNHIGKLNIDTDAVAKLQRHLKNMQQFQNLITDAGALRGITQTLKLAERSAGKIALHQAAAQMEDLRNALAKLEKPLEPWDLTSPAYRLDGENDG